MVSTIVIFGEAWSPICIIIQSKVPIIPKKERREKSNLISQNELVMGNSFNSSETGLAQASLRTCQGTPHPPYMAFEWRRVFIIHLAMHVLTNPFVKMHLPPQFIQTPLYQYIMYLSLTSFLLNLENSNPNELGLALLRFLLVGKPPSSKELWLERERESLWSYYFSLHPLLFKIRESTPSH